MIVDLLYNKLSKLKLGKYFHVIKMVEIVKNASLIYGLIYQSNMVFHPTVCVPPLQVKEYLRSRETPVNLWPINFMTVICHKLNRACAQPCNIVNSQSN